MRGLPEPIVRDYCGETDLYSAAQIRAIVLPLEVALTAIRDSTYRNAVTLRAMAAAALEAKS